MKASPGRTFKLTLAYDGTPFVGWQRQSSGVSVQGVLEEALARFDEAPVTVIGAGRTDAGVHALGQVASVHLASGIGPAVLQRALNATLPPAIRVLRVEEKDASFHPRYAAHLKTYHYGIANGPFLSPFDPRVLWLVSQPLDLERMADAASRLVGRHDFAGFRSAGSGARTTIRTVTESTFRRAGPGEPAWATPPLAAIGAERLLYVITGTGFLRQMVRAIVGTLVEVGTGRRSPADIEQVLASGARVEAGPTAPPHGLCLMQVTYADDRRDGSSREDPSGGPGDDRLATPCSGL